ncbi:MAG: DUF1223 domain-containing protein [Alphaproteobacteria bacterium]|nr:DUF1223 domain-containing protein [Alphaproteobacteria bacterium]
MKHYLQAAVLSFAALGVLPHGGAVAEQSKAQPTVVELFTSQSCYSCPPAEKILGELAQRDDIIALEHHVDYWDQLVYGSAGRWKDIFSSPESTDRQRRYNNSVPGRGYSYTPQMFFDGKTETVGNRKRAVRKEIKKAQGAIGERLSIAVAPLAEGGLTITVDGKIADKAGIWLLHYKDKAAVQPTGGENKDKNLVNHNIVHEVRRVGDWTGTQATVDVADYKYEEGFSCVILVQTARPGPVIGAARCPALAS